MKYRSVCIIPARSGSKRVKNKNITIINKKPIISHVIETCKRAKIFDKIIVSTDSKKIKKISEKYNAEVPSLRPKEFSNDNAKINSVIKYCLKTYRLESFDFIFCLFPTAIMITPTDLKNALNFMIKKKSFSFIECVKV